jgi:hypothetical protein
MATTGFDWTCRCGKVELRVTPGRVRNVTCYCNHCRHFAEEYGEGDTLDEGGGVPMLVTTNDAISVVSGGDLMVAMHYSEKGPLRWYTSCCGTPVAITAGVARTPYMSVHAARLEPSDKLGPPQACVNTKSATGPVSKSVGFVPALFGGFMIEMLGSRISGRWRNSPFFKPDGSPVAAPEIRPWSPA